MLREGIKRDKKQILPSPRAYAIANYDFALAILKIE